MVCLHRYLFSCKVKKNYIFTCSTFQTLSSIAEKRCEMNQQDIVNNLFERQISIANIIHI
jgi:hypothetical protein